jgi:hypothetical protein
VVRHGVEQRTALAAALAGIALLAATAALPTVKFFDGANVGDTPLYHTYGENMRHGKLPYRDFFEEYPPGALPAFVLPAVLPGASFTLWSKALQWLLAACCIVFAVVTLRAARWRAALIGLTPALLGQVTFTRFDFWPAALTAASVAAMVARRDRLAFALLAVAVSAKIYPVVLLPVFLLALPRRDRTIGTAIFAAVLAAVALPFATLGPGGVRYSVENLFRRPLQVESLGGSLLLVLHRVGGYTPHVVSTYGSQNLSGGAASALGLLTTLLGVAALVVVWVLFARSHRDARAVIAASAASVLAFVAFGRVLSPQYVIWLVPALAVVARRWSLVLLGLVVGLTQVWSQGRYHDVTAGRPIVWAVLARDLVLVGLYVLAAATVARRARAPSTASPAAQSVNSSGSPA